MRGVRRQRRSPGPPPRAARGPPAGSRRRSFCPVRVGSIRSPHARRSARRPQLNRNREPQARTGTPSVLCHNHLSMVTESAVLAGLMVVKDPDLQRDIVTLGFIKNLKIEGGRVAFSIELTTPACPVKDQLRDQAHAAVSAIPGVTSVEVDMTASVRAVMSPEAGRAPVEGVKNVIAVGAGKGGVGKTTVAVNLAIALAKCGSRVGIIDGDIYGPNVPIMLGINQQLTTDGKKILPAEKHGLQVISMGFMTTEEAPVIWRGPMLHGAIQQFFREVRWDNLDYLIVDMPPGTGDVALSLS